MSTQPQQYGIEPQWTLGDRLRKARSLTGLSTRDFAREIGTSQKTVSDAENDHHTPRRPIIAAYAMRTGVDLEWLLGRQQPTPGRDPGPGVVKDGAPTEPYVLLRGQSPRPSLTSVGFNPSRRQAARAQRRIASPDSRKAA